MYTIQLILLFFSNRRLHNSCRQTILHLLFQVRKKTSAKDNRPPPMAIGVVAIIFISTLFGIMVLCDVGALVRDARQMMDNIRTGL